eukprot:gene11287-4098_t
MTRKIQKPNDLRKIKDLLVSCPVNVIETFFEVIEFPDVLPKFFAQWTHQSKEQAFISNVFFPMELEEPNDTLNYLYQKERIHKKLSICVKSDHPLSMLHASNIIKQYFESEEQLPKCFTKLLERSKEYFKYEKSKKTDYFPFFEMGQICYFLEENPMNFYKKSEDDRCIYKVETQNDNVEAIKKMSDFYPPSNIYLGYNEKNSEKALKFFIKSGENYVPYGYFEAGCLLLSENKIDSAITFFEKASKKAISSAYLTLAEYYHDISDYKKEKEIYLEAGKNDVPYAYICLGNKYKRKVKKKAKSYYDQDILGGYKYSLTLEENDIEKRKRDAITKLTQYFDSLFNTN